MALQLQAEARLPTELGQFKIMAFSESPEDWRPTIALVADQTDFSKPVNVRFHSECITGEVFHSSKCECGPQLDAAMAIMQQEGGVIIYLRQEGRDIGIINKIRAYALQDKGLDTVQANLEQGLPADGRDFSAGIEVLRHLNISRINLLTNNPEKIAAIRESGLELVSVIPLKFEPNEENKGYLETKRNYFKHLL